MRIALDLDGVLADLQTRMIDQTRYTWSDFQDWGKPDYNHFLSEASRIWSDQHEQISSVDHNIDYKTQQLAEHHEVDIVTNTAGPDDAVCAWLERHGVHYDELVRPYSMGCDKPDLDYDAYIDDKPGMVGQVPVQYLRDRQWNQHLREDDAYEYHSMDGAYTDAHGPIPTDPFGDDRPHVIRVFGLGDAVNHLEDHRRQT